MTTVLIGPSCKSDSHITVLVRSLLYHRYPRGKVLTIVTKATTAILSATKALPAIQKEHREQMGHAIREFHLHAFGMLAMQACSKAYPPD